MKRRIFYEVSPNFQSLFFLSFPSGRHPDEQRDDADGDAKSQQGIEFPKQLTESIVNDTGVKLREGRHGGNHTERHQKAHRRPEEKPEKVAHSSPPLLKNFP